MKGDDAFEGVRPLTPGQWKVNPSTGVLSLTEGVLQKLINPEPIETLYTLDPEPIARGQFAVVYHCHHRITGEEFAAKFSSRWRLGSDCTSDLVHEIAVCAVLRPNARAVQLVDVFSNDRELILVMEYAPGGDLQTLLDENLVPYERDVIKFMRQLLEGLAFIHDRNIVHLDIKPQNLVLMGEFPECAIKLCDFEISRMLTPGQEVREILGTPDYVAPEILHYEPITTRTDMWSVGVLTYVLLTGFLPFGGENDQETFVEILKCELDFPSELFEDITPEAIDFISKLLIRHPEQRMNAQECLNHSWIKRGVKIPIERPSSLSLNCNLNNPKPVIPVTTQVTVTPSISCQMTNENIVKEQPKQNFLSQTLSDGPKTQQQLPSSKDIGRPPLHPSSSQKSLYSETPSIAGTPVTTPGSCLASPFIYRQESKFGSRHNLDRLRSLSKSREVLSERIQMSNLKKSMSKSREKLGMTKSREQLLALSSFSQFSQSVEALSAFSHFGHHNNALYQSCCNIFVPKLYLQQNSNNGPERMYQSLAAIDQIDKMNYSKKGYFESRMSLNDNDYSNDIITQRNTDMNCFVGDMKFDKTLENKNPLGLRANTCKGGRGGDSCDNRCARHRQAEPKLTQKITKINRSEKLKRDAQKRRREKKEKERLERLKREKENREKEKQKAAFASAEKSFDKSPQEGSSSPSFRRGSVCHVEQRIQERHERNQERLERQEKEDRKQKKRLSVELDRSSSTEKPKPKLHTLGVSTLERPRSITPTRRRKSKKKASPQGSDVSQASSLESVDVTDEIQTPDVVQSIQVPEIKILSRTEDLENNNNTLTTEETVEADEAYVSLEEPAQIATQITEDNSSDETDNTVTEKKEESKLSSSDDEMGVETLSVSDKILGFEKGLISSLQKHPSILNKQKSITETISGDIKDLFIINEESSSTENLNEIIGTPFKRSISNTSDFGSQMSESSEGSFDREEETHRPLKVFTEKKDLLSPEWKARSRSFSVHACPSPPPIPKGRSRSNSFNFDGNDCSVARPWGTVCSGSVARAFEKFNLKTTERSRKTSSLLISPSEELLPSFD